MSNLSDIKPVTYLKANSLLKLVSMSEEEIRQGKIIDNESVFNSIEKKLKKHEKRFKISWSEHATLDLERLISHIAAAPEKQPGNFLKNEKFII